MKKYLNPFREWAIEQHRKTNHLYDGIIPYEFHLHMIAREVVRHLAKGNRDHTHLGLNAISGRDMLIDAAYGHDLIEDTRNTYNDLRDKGGARFEVADIIYALTDDKGRNRLERGNNEHYRKLVLVPGAAFVKFCDRIANTRYSQFAESAMYDKYREENPNFMRRCYIPELEPYGLVQTMESLFE